MQPHTIKRRNPVVLSASWPDGFEAHILLSSLRDACPCAYCVGEQVMGQTVYIGIKAINPRMNELASLVSVGNYAIQASWNDGHNSGIYTWDQFRMVFEQNALSEQTLVELDELYHQDQQ